MKGLVGAFDRNKPVQNRTFSLRLFNRYETEINEHFWSFKVISEHSRFIAAERAEVEPDAKTADVFSASGPDSVRIPPTVTDWLAARKELENWLRLSVLVSAAAYHETYLRQVARSALMSDPLCRFGASKSIDGIYLLKSGKELPFDDEITSLTKGDWSHRASNFSKVFSPLPESFQGYISDLDSIRILRNKLSHAFGRDIDAREPSHMESMPSSRISTSTLMGYLKTLSKTASIIDRHLLENFIGNFELIHYYHKWKLLPRRKEDSAYSEARALKRSFFRDAMVPITEKFCEEMISYYRSAA